jgi:hypothetical protein
MKNVREKRRDRKSLALPLESYDIRRNRDTKQIDLVPALRESRSVAVQRGSTHFPRDVKPKASFSRSFEDAVGPDQDF